MAIKASLPKGTRDFLPTAMRQRQYIQDTIKEVFIQYGFEPIETPALEKTETLSGKYGEEGDRLIFKILPRGRKMDKLIQAASKQAWREQIEEALRYDLTVPLARFLVQNQNELDFPFKRFQMQPVWRADSPQKGRYREFVQCDADAVGPSGLVQDLEFLAIYQRVFDRLELPVRIRINHRQILEALALALGVENTMAFTVILDKLDKIGMGKMLEEMSEQLKLQPAQANRLKELLEQASGAEQLAQLKKILPPANEGLEEIDFILEGARELGLSSVLFDPSLARGLDYYTGCIFEVIASEITLGSLGGGGRYDNLTEMFGGQNLPGVGISFGLDRIQLALQESDKFSENFKFSSEVLFLNLGAREVSYAMDIAERLRDQGLRTEVFPKPIKMGKQLEWADRKGIEKAVIIGSRELDSGQLRLKNLKDGTQKDFSRAELIAHLIPTNNIAHGRH